MGIQQQPSASHDAWEVPENPQSTLSCKTSKKIIFGSLLTSRETSKIFEATGKITAKKIFPSLKSNRHSN
jgi:hypothetical protein